MLNIHLGCGVDYAIVDVSGQSADLPALREHHKRGLIDSSSPDHRIAVFKRLSSTQLGEGNVSSPLISGDAVVLRAGGAKSDRLR